MITPNYYLKRVFTLIFGAVLMFSCSNDETDGNGTLKISAKASVNNGAGKGISSGKNVNTDVFVSDFRINIREFELEMDESEFEVEFESESESGGEFEFEAEWDDDGYFDYEDEFELEGPFELDLLAGEISFLNVDVPNATFEELEFKFDRGTNPDSDLFGKSVLIQGTVNDIPFVFWNDFEDEVEVDFEDNTIDIRIKDNTEGITIEFDLSQIFDVVSGVDLSQASDGNEDGTIEISPEDTDGNNALAEQIRERIKTVIDLLDD